MKAEDAGAVGYLGVVGEKGDCPLRSVALSMFCRPDHLSRSVVFALAACSLAGCGTLNNRVECSAWDYKPVSQQYCQRSLSDGTCEQYAYRIVHQNVCIGTRCKDGYNFTPYSQGATGCMTREESVAFLASEKLNARAQFDPASPSYRPPAGVRIWQEPAGTVRDSKINRCSGQFNYGSVTVTVNGNRIMIEPLASLGNTLGPTFVLADPVTNDMTLMFANACNIASELRLTAKGVAPLSLKSVPASARKGAAVTSCDMQFVLPADWPPSRDVDYSMSWSQGSFKGADVLEARRLGHALHDGFALNIAGGRQCDGSPPP